MVIPDVQLTRERALTGKSVVVTGASGYLAAAFMVRLAPVDCTIFRVTRGSDLPRLESVARVVDVKADLANPDAAAEVVSRADVIFHLSAQTSVPIAERDPALDEKRNVRPALEILAAIARSPRRPALVFASTATVVGLAESLPVDETAAVRPLTVYDRHKAAVESQIARFAREENVRAAALRLPNVFGPGPRSTQGDRGVLNQMIARALRGEALTIFGAGDQLRDYVYVDDVVSAFLLAAVHIDSLAGGSFVIASGRGRTFATAVMTVAERVRNATGASVRVEHANSVKISAIESRNYVGDSSRFAEVTGWVPQVGFDTGIDLTIKSLLADRQSF